MKITLSRDEITEILQKKAQQIGEDCCADDQKVLSVNIPHLGYTDTITIEIGAATVEPPEFHPYVPPSPAAPANPIDEEVQF
jgi:hypothetical protein